jgi:hypothetical protein
VKFGVSQPEGRRNIEGAVRKISEPKREENVTGEWTYMHNEELHNLYPSRNISALWTLTAFTVSESICSR